MDKSMTPTKPKRSVPTRYLTATAVLSALAAGLMFADFALPIFPVFLKLDFSELPALIAGFALGPVAAVAVELVKNLFHLIVKTSTGGVGELANFLIGVAFVLPASLLYRHLRSRKGALIGMLIGTLSIVAVGVVVNLFITIPFYAKVMPMDVIIRMGTKILPWADTLPRLVLVFIAPFNLLKGLVISLVTFAVYKPISWVIKNLGRKETAITEDVFEGE
jgi:riboflavin transporter FmnP